MDGDGEVARKGDGDLDIAPKSWPRASDRADCAGNEVGDVEYGYGDWVGGGLGWKYRFWNDGGARA